MCNFLSVGGIINLLHIIIRWWMNLDWILCCFLVFHAWKCPSMFMCCWKILNLEWFPLLEVYASRWKPRLFSLTFLSLLLSFFLSFVFKLSYIIKEFIHVLTIANYVSFSVLPLLFCSFFISLSSISTPHNVFEALSQSKWQKAMEEELWALKKNNIWDIVDLPKGKVPVGCKWAFTIKLKPNSSVERYKARLVVKGYTQTYGIDS